MNHWGVGRIDSRCQITIPEYVLRPISINVGAMVWGMFYPVSQTDDGYKKNAELDFVFSPIPYEIWPKTARCTVRVHHVPGAFNQVTEALLKCNASIIISDASRSAHSYDTWRLIISCDNIDVSGDGYICEERQYQGMVKELEHIERVIEAECEDVLFIDPCDTTKADPVVCAPHNAMAYFYAISKNRKLIKNAGVFEEWAICNPFKMIRQKDGSLEPADGKFSAILENLNKHNDGDILPSYCFIESQSEDMNMRLVVIPKNREAHFYKLNVGFHRSGSPATSKGMVDFVLRRVCENANVWAINNKTMMFDEIREEGEAEFLVEGQRMADIEERTHNLKEKINTKSIPNSLKTITKISLDCESISRSYMYQNVSKDKGVKIQHDIFISYSSVNTDEAIRLRRFLRDHGVDCFLSEKENGRAKIPYGVDYRDFLRDEINSSKLIALICSPDSISSRWVLKELGAAWALGKPVVPIVLNMKMEDISEEIINNNQSVYYHFAVDNPSFAEDIKQLIEKS